MERINTADSMISYKPSDWLNFLFSFHKSDTFRQLGILMLALGLYAYGVRYVEKEYFHIDVSSEISKLTILHTILGTVMSLLLVFRTNTAYDRWWEGRKLWGSLTNSSRNLASKMNAILHFSDHENRNFYRKSIPLFAITLSHHLLLEKTRTELDQDFTDEFEMPADVQHKPNYLASIIHNRTYKLRKEEKITESELLSINSEISNFLEVAGGCERIKNTPIPYSYSSFLRKFILFYIITLPWVFSATLGNYVIPFSIFIFYVLGSLELIAEEIEDPFGGDENDVPIEKISQNIKRNVSEIIR
jgi:putative membrane protein